MEQLELDLSGSQEPASPVININGIEYIRPKRALEIEMDYEITLKRAWNKAVDFELSGDPCDLPTKEEEKLIVEFLHSDYYEGSDYYQPQPLADACCRIEEKYCPEGIPVFKNVTTVAKALGVNI